MKDNQERVNSNGSNMYRDFEQKIQHDLHSQGQGQPNVVSKSLWPNNQQSNHLQNQRQQMVSKQNAGTVHGKTPMLMANNDVFTIGPYRARKDRQRVSVLKKYEIIGYIAAGTYGKVYKAKKQGPDQSMTTNDPNNSGNSTNNNANPGSINNGRQTNDQVARALKAGTEMKSNNIMNERDTRNRLDSKGSLSVASGNAGNSIKDPINLTMDNSFSNSGQDSKLNTGSTTQSTALGNPNNNLMGSSRTTTVANPGVVYTSLKQKSIPAYYAIKKFKTEKEGVEQLHYTGISQSACREIALCRELNNEHLTRLTEIFLERKSIYLVYEYAEHDLLQIIHYHSHPEKRMIPARMVRSIMWQILDGVSYLHQNWILHRDLKPANIMVSVDGCVKIGDLGLARKFSNMLQTLYTGDKVVVTIWYRAPERLLGARHYTPAIDVWAVGCIFAELIGLQPIFKGEETKMDSKKTVPFQANQLQRILEVLGTPSSKNWSNLHKYPEYEQFLKFPKFRNNLPAWYHSTGGRDKNALDLLHKLLEYDPIKRIDAINSLDHNYFTNGDYPVCENVFEGLNYKYPARRIHTNDNDIMNLGVHRSKNLNPQQQAVVNNSAANTLGGLGVNRRILAAAAAAAAAVTGSNPQGNSRGQEPSRKKRR